MCYTVNLVLKPNSPCFFKLFSASTKFVSNYLANHIFSPPMFCVENAKHRKVTRIITHTHLSLLSLGWPVNFVPIFQFFFFFFFFFWLHNMACGIIVPWPGIEPVQPAVEAQSPNHWTTREFPPIFQFLIRILLRQYQWKWKITDWIIKMKKTKQNPQRSSESSQHFQTAKAVLVTDCRRNLWFNGSVVDGAQGTELIINSAGDSAIKPGLGPLG